MASEIERRKKGESEVIKLRVKSGDGIWLEFNPRVVSSVGERRQSALRSAPLSLAARVPSRQTTAVNRLSPVLRLGDHLVFNFGSCNI